MQPISPIAELDLVNGLWIGDSLPLVAQLCIVSFLRHGHRFRLFVYGKVSGIPAETEVADAAVILPEREIFYHQSGSLAHFSDWFRYILLAKEGGIWTDLDVVCLKPFVPDPLPWFALHSANEVAVGFLAFPKGHALPPLLAKFASDPATEMPWDTVRVREQKETFHREKPEIKDRRIHNPYGSTGPTEFTKAVHYFGLMETAASIASIYPVPWTHWRWYFNGHLRLDDPMFAQSWALHLWGELLRREPDAFEQLSPSSIVATLLELNNLPIPESPVLLGQNVMNLEAQDGRRIYATHPHWRDELIFFPNGMFQRVATKCRGKWIELPDGCIGLRWDGWPPEMLIPDRDDNPDHFHVIAWRTLSRCPASPVDFSFAILNHDNPERLLRLVRALSELFGNPPICCHHDFGQCALNETDFPSNVMFVRPSIPTNWGGFSLVDAALMALRQCLSFAPRWTYLLSGADFPIVSRQQMIEDLQVKDWSGHLHLELIDPECIQRPWHNTCVNRYLSREGWPAGHACYAGSQWMTLGLRAIDYLSECFARNHPLINHYRACEIPDESLFHSLLANNPSLELNTRNWTYVDWSPGCPKYLTVDDLELARQSGCHFARKFDGPIEMSLVMKTTFPHET